MIAAVPIEPTPHSAPAREREASLIGLPGQSGRNTGFCEVARQSGGLLPPDPAEMGKGEPGGIFQAVAERPVDADMGKPDQGN